MKYFSIHELCASVRAEELGIKNEPTQEVCQNLKLLVAKILDPARQALGKPITVNSGYRCAKLNKVIGGSPTSHHVTGQAADIELGNKSKQENKQLYDWIARNCEFDQLINEYDYAWIHVSYREGKNRKQLRSIG